MSAAIATYTGRLTPEEHEYILRGTTTDETFHIAATPASAVNDRTNGGGTRSLAEAIATMHDIRTYAPGTRLTIFRVTVEAVQS